MNLDLKRLLDPKTVAVIGASSKEQSIGGIILKELTRSHCLLYPVNPKYQALRGMRCYASVLDIPDSLDLAVITVPAPVVPPVLEECGKKGIPYAVVIAGGFGETGDEGKSLEEQVVEIARRYGIRILGPNTLGIFFPERSFDTIFVEHGDKSLAGGGGVAVISQSGSVGIEALGLASNIGFGLRTFVGLGNKCDLDELDFLTYFAEEPGTSCIAFYLENVNKGREFLAQARKVSRKKPIVGLKAGRTVTGASAVSSHTGRLAGSDLVVEGALRQHGILRVQDDEELTDASRVLEKCPLPRGNRVAVVSPAGGYGVICADYIETPDQRAALQMARLLPETEQQIREATFPFASCHNPVDITASASSAMYGGAMEAILADPGVDILICLVFWSPPGIEDDLLDIIATRVQNSEKPVLIFTTYGPFTDKYLLEFWKRDVVGFPSLKRTVEAARFLVDRQEMLTVYDEESAQENIRPTPGNHVTEKRTVLETWCSTLRHPGKPDEYEVKKLLAQFGIPVPGGSRIIPPEKLNTGRDSLNFPVVVKVCSPQILHKTDAGGIRTGVGREELDSVLEEFAHRFPGEPLLVEEQVRYLPPEMIIGGLEDPLLGPAVVVGAGGILTELYQDVSSRLCPCTPL
ncbi:MAG TPA: acetate--CoA ligase family protein, partial [Spirochaetales bacterium]|nr:acetate--CoA ligase family protein [Spirochaetales bacterium]